MKNRNFLRAKKAIDQVQSDLEKRKRGRQEYRPNRSSVEPSEVIQPTAYIVNQVQQRTGFSKKQTCFLMSLTAILTVICLCGGLISAPFIIGPPPSPLFQPTPVPVFSNNPTPAQRPENQTREGLMFSSVRLMPFIPDNSFVQPGPGNWWSVEVTVYNPTAKPITLRGYDVVLRDHQGREFWYDRNLSMFAVQGGFIEQLNPGVTVIMPIVFNLPDELAGITMHYDRAIVPIGPDQIVR